MRCKDIIKKLQELSPPEFAEEWDNSGMQVGDNTQDIQKIMIALDATDEVIEEAVNERIDLLITHHPLIFHPIKSVTADNFITRRVIQLVRSNICLYSMHTNFDVMGMADAAADELELRDREVLEVTYKDEISNEGIGRFGPLPHDMTLRECAEYVKKRMGIETVRIWGDPGMTVVTAAVSPGSCKSVLESAVKANVDVLITGDVDHHSGLDMVHQGVAVIDAGHYGTEKLFMNYIKDYIARELPGMIVIAKETKNPFADI